MLTLASIKQCQESPEVLTESLGYLSHSLFAMKSSFESHIKTTFKKKLNCNTRSAAV